MSQTLESMLEAMVEKAVAAALKQQGGKVQSTAKAAQPKAGAATATMVGEPTMPDFTGEAVYFSDDQIKAGEGYRCSAAKPCDRLLKGPARTGHGPKGHTAA